MNQNGDCQIEEELNYWENRSHILNLRIKECHLNGRPEDRLNVLVLDSANTVDPVTRRPLLFAKTHLAMSLNLRSHDVKSYRSEVLLLMVETEGVEPLHPGQGQHPRHVLRVNLYLFYSLQVSCQTLIFSSFSHFSGSPVVLPHEGTAANEVPQGANRHCRPQVPGQ